MSENSKRQNAEGLLSRRGEEQECTPDIVKLAVINSSAVFTDEGIVVIDVPLGNRAGREAVEAIRKRSQKPIHSIIYTHGHMDHIWSVPAFYADAEEKGFPKPHIIGHEAVARRFDRYQRLKGQHEHINTIQFAIPKGAPVLPKQFFGGLTFELYGYLGETDDSLWVWIPERKTALVGDLLVSGAPNVGNPFKVQRYALEWAAALEQVAGKNPDCVVAANQVFYGEQCQEVCLDTARYLRFIEEEVVRLLNEGCWIEEILERIEIPEDLAGKPWLAPVYGHPAFIIHGVHRRYAGWYNGNPSELFPSNSSDIAAEIVKLTSTEQLLERANQLRQSGAVQLALHLVDFIIKGSEDESKRKEALILKAELLGDRADAEPSYIARNIFSAGATLVKQQADSIDL
jgi:alkyl sulfatase BDS1-like metallo-beta-lactamase superfamily hydrolase